MKILFLCGSLEPGKDGVGDYTRRLAGELIRQGHNASIISLNDRFIDTVLQTAQESDGTNVTVLRLPAVLLNKDKYNAVENYINSFTPDWVSLQYVPHSFNKYGLAWSILSLKKKIERKKYQILCNRT
jgi:hypothetical protein